MFKRTLGSILMLFYMALFELALCSIEPIMAVLLPGVFSSGSLAYQVPDYTVSN